MAKAIRLPNYAIVPFFRELRDKPTTTTLVNICACLIAVYLFFAIGVGRVKHHQACNGLTFLLHYFTLASFSWMTVNAYRMLRAFTSVRVCSYNSQRYSSRGPRGIFRRRTYYTKIQSKNFIYLKQCCTG